MKLLAFLGGAAWIVANALREPVKAWMERADGPQHAVVDVPDGADVRVRGHLEPREEALTSPLTSRECVAYRLRVAVRDTAMVGADPWHQVCLDERVVPVSLVDPTGRARLGDVTHWHMKFDANGGIGRWNDLKGPEAAGLRRRLSELGVRTDYIQWDHDVRVEEAVIATSEPVVVTGRGRWELDPSVRASGYRDVGRTLRLEPMSFGRLVVSKSWWDLRRTPER